MFCPKCGTAEQAANSYCRNCGEFLPDVDKLARQTRRRGFGGSTPEENIKTTVYLSLISALFALFAAFTLYASIAGIPVSSGMMAAAFAFSLCIASYQISNVVIAFKLRKRIVRRRELTTQPENELNNAPPMTSLNAADTSQIVRPASVTENTTELLKPAAHQRKS